MKKLLPVFACTITKHKLVFNNKSYFDKYLQSLADGNYELVIKQRQKIRSLNQNSYYWGVIIHLISEHTGMTLDEAHEAMKLLFLKHKVGNIETLRSTANMSTVDFEDYQENVRRFASMELNIYIPLPNEVVV